MCIHISAVFRKKENVSPSRIGEIMNRFFRIAFSGVVAALSFGTAEAQQKGGQPVQKSPGTAQPGFYHGGIGQSAWFSNSGGPTAIQAE
jgi:hypothetical protein